MVPGEYEEFMQKSECQHFEEDIACVHETLGQMAVDMGLQVYRQGINEYRHQNKGNTYTNKDRAILLKEAIAMASVSSGDFFDNPVHDILIVGPGLEEVHPEWGVVVPRQSYEPFAVTEAAVKFGQANADDLRVDLVDINPRVVTYFSELIAAAKDGVAHPVFWSETPTDVSPSTLRQFHVSAGDIISDALAPEEKYDWIVMMNTFMYFNDTEKLLAAENIARMLKPGGMLFTDLDPAFLPTHIPDTCGSSSASALQSQIVVGHDNIPYPVVIYRKSAD